MKSGRDETFRVAVRRFGPFESAIRKQWEHLEAGLRAGRRLEAVPLDLHPLHEALFESGGAASGDWDAAFLATDWMAEAAESGAFRDLAPYLGAAPPEGHPDAWTPSLLRLQRFGQRVLGLPYHDGPECLIYRTDLFGDLREQSSYLAQTGHPLAPPETWEEFHRIARHFTRPERSLYGTVFAGYPDGHNTVYDFCLQLWTRGGELLDADGRIVLDSPQAAEALRFYRRILRDRTAVHPGCANFDSVKSGLAFAAGEVAMMVNWFGFAAMSQTIAESKVRDRVAVARLPADGGPRVSLNVYWVLAIPAGTRSPDLAWRFLRHCASPAMDKLLTLEGGIGCRRSTWEDTDVNRAIPFYRAMEGLHEEARELPRLTGWARIGAVIDELMLGVTGSERDPRELLAEAQRRIGEIAA